MKIFNKKAITLFITFFPLLIFSQSSMNCTIFSDSIAKRIIGKWELYKQTLTENDTTREQIINGKKIKIYEFKSDGTYKLTEAYISEFKHDKLPDTSVIVGNWKVFTDNNKIWLCNNKYLPPYEKLIYGDLNIPIAQLTRTEFVTHFFGANYGTDENGFFYFKESIGTCYYKKQGN